MNENVEVTVTVLVPQEALMAQVVTTEGITQEAQEYVNEAVADFEAMKRRVRLRRNIGVQIGDGNKQTNTFNL